MGSGLASEILLVRPMSPSGKLRPPAIGEFFLIVVLLLLPFSQRLWASSSMAFAATSLSQPGSSVSSSEFQRIESNRVRLTEIQAANSREIASQSQTLPCQVMCVQLAVPWSRGPSQPIESDLECVSRCQSRYGFGVIGVPHQTGKGQGSAGDTSSKPQSASP